MNHICARCGKTVKNIKRCKKTNQIFCWACATYIRREKVKKRAIEYKGGKCLKCGYNKYFGNLTFHHRDPLQKDFTISGQSISFDKLKSEVDKCELLCHNCHGELHAGLITI